MRYSADITGERCLRGLRYSTQLQVRSGHINNHIELQVRSYYINNHIELCLPRVLFGELYDVLLNELPHPTGAPITLTELDGQPGQLGDEPAQPVLQGGVTVDPARLEEHRFACHIQAVVWCVYSGILE